MAHASTHPKTEKIIDNQNINLFDLTQATMREWLKSSGHPAFRGDQILTWLYKQEQLDFDKMHNVSQSCKQLLHQSANTTLPIIIDTHQSEDGTIKWLMQLTTGQHIETVFIPEKNRGTLCISSQVGCALACSFCATGLLGLNKNLKTHEIIGQVWLARHALKQQDPHRRHPITNVVFMGMGEPLMNEKHVYPALEILLEDYGFGLSKYRVTISTSGIVPAIKRLQHTSPCALAISLHAPNNALRDKLVPINQSFPLEELISACQNYFANTSRHIMIEYILLHNINDQITHADQLIQIAKKFPCKINLIPYNHVESLPHQRSTDKQSKAFQMRLQQAGFITTIRKQRGDPIAAACGQLAGIKSDRTSKTIKQQVT